MTKKLNIYKQARKQLNLTQKDIATTLNISQATISKIEQGKIGGLHFIKYIKFLAQQEEFDIRNFIKNIEI
ncbi:helix-turn-helix domain-containing protein [Capnocytophaga canimorsus]|uniref:helix-turn-helix domain-containing protein n=1 Tax=Capnocytophaga canimorsus TaxID=28188 RepID=UPI0037CEBF8F